MLLIIKRYPNTRTRIREIPYGLLGTVIDRYSVYLCIYVLPTYYTPLFPICIFTYWVNW